MSDDHSWIESSGPRLEEGLDDFQYFDCSKCGIVAMFYIKTKNFYYYDSSHREVTDPVCSEEQVRAVLDE